MSTPRSDMDNGALASAVFAVLFIIAVWVGLWLLFTYAPRSAHGGELPEGMHLMTEVVKADTVLTQLEPGIHLIAVSVKMDTVYAPLKTRATDERERLDSIIAERWNVR